MPEPTFTPRPAAAPTAAPAGMLPQLYSYALGPLNAAYYQKQFERLDTAPRLVPSWNTAAAFFTFGWLVLRRFWRGLAFYAPLWLFAVATAAAMRGRVPLGLEIGVDAILAAILIAAPGLMANALYHRHINAATIAALQQSATLAQAQQQLEREHAVTPQRQRQVTIGHAAATAALAILGTGLAWWNSAQPEEQTLVVAPPAPVVGPPVLHFPPLPSTASSVAPSAATDAAPLSPAASDPAAPSAPASAVLPQQASPEPTPEQPASPPPVSAEATTPTAATPDLAANAPLNPSAMSAASAENPTTAPMASTPETVSATPAALAPAPAQVQHQPLPTPVPAVVAPAQPQPTPAPQPAPVQPSAAPQPYAPISAQPQTATQSPAAPLATPAPAEPTPATPTATANPQPQPAQQPATSQPLSQPPSPSRTASTPAQPAPAPRANTNTPPRQQPTAPANAGALVAGKYYLSVGVYAEAANARRNERNLRAAGLPVISQTVSGQRGTMTRIRLGPFDTRAQAEQAQRTAARQGFETSVFQHRR